MEKIFVLDTCVLIHDPECILNFGEHEVRIPLESIKELDRIKTEDSDRGKSARSAQRKLLAYLPDLGSGTKPLPTGGCIGVLLPPPQAISKKAACSKLLGGIESADHRIIASAVWAMETQPEKETILVTKDMGMALTARACKLKAEDYKYDKTLEKESEIEEIEIDPSELARFSSEGIIELDIARIPKDLETNAYGLFSANKKTPWRHVGFGRFVRVANGPIGVPNGIELRARNLEQVFLTDALLNPEIHLVTASGPAGTGKTLLTMAASLKMVVGTKDYTGICISKANEPVGKENGFLPGAIEEKMRPWLQPYADALNFLYRKPTQQNKKQSERKSREPGPIKKPYDLLTEAGIVEITAIEHIRGRSIPNRILIIDECQNLPLKVVKTITTRIAEGAKLIYLGDPDQIDNPYLDKYSNGLTHIRTKMKNLANAAHIHLRKGERSLLAEQAAKLL